MSSDFLRGYWNQIVPDATRSFEAPGLLEHVIWNGVDTKEAILEQVLAAVVPRDSGFTVSSALRLLDVIAELSGQELGCEHLAHKLGELPHTSLQYLGMLELAGLWRHVPCFERKDPLMNHKSKGYMTSTTALCQYVGVSSPEVMRLHPAWGAIFETFIVMRVIASLPVDAHIFYWRTAHGGFEVDIVVQRGNVLFPIEVKSAVRVSLANTRKIQVFSDYYRDAYRVAPGLVVYTGAVYYALGPQLYAVPWMIV